MNKNINRISEGAEAASAQTDSAAGTIVELVALSKLLKEEMDRFKVA